MRQIHFFHSEKLIESEGYKKVRSQFCFVDMWNERPLDSSDINPFGTKKEKSGEEPLTADSCKCPTCGSNMVYEPQLESMLCKNCGNLYDPNGLEPKGSLGINTEHDYTADGDMSEEDKKRHEIFCNSCGAVLVADENTASTMCPFCGSPALITRRMTREFKPDYIVPFKIDREQAGEIMNNWLASRKYTPLGFKSKCRLTKMVSLYVPFWLLDCKVTSDITGTGKKYEGIGTKIIEVSTTYSYYVKNLPFNASRKIANKLLEAIEPYDFSEMARFESKYLQGFYADKYDQLPTEMIERMRKRIDRYSRSQIQIIADQYDEYEDRSDRMFTRLNDINVKYCLLPVWFMTVEYEGGEYQYAINGQTGEASGIVPVTESFDILGKLTGWMKGVWQWIPMVFVVLLFAAIILVANLQAVLNSLHNLLAVLIVCEIVIAASYLIMLLIKDIDKNLVRRKRQKAYDINDYKEDPGFDCYFDEEKDSNIKVNENLLTRVVRVKDKNGKVIRENNYDF